METIVKQLPFWKDLTSQQQAQLLAYCQLRTFQKGDILEHGNEECHGLEIMVNGQARVFMMSPQGNEITLYRLLEQDICVLSAACMIHSLTFQVRMEFEEASQILLVPQSVLQSLSQQNCHVKDFIMELVADRFSSVMNTMYDVMFSSNEQRLANVLWNQIQLQQSLHLTLTHDMLAREMGTAREVVSRLLKQLQKQKLLTLKRGSIFIRDEEGLRRLASGTDRSST